VTESALIVCNRVTVIHGAGDTAVHALASVDVEVRAGEYLGLLGPSGSGKTTLLHVLGGLVQPHSGTVERNTRLSAYVFQGANLLPSLTVRENIAFALLAARRTDSPDDSLALVGLERRAEALPSELSGGEQQRVAIARALAQRPQLLLCDEPTGHLDSDTGRRVLDLIGSAREMLGFAVVMATHDPGVAERADRTVELADGALLAGEPV
jgi:putative ABC transport system ATP-binding protein